MRGNPASANSWIFFSDQLPNLGFTVTKHAPKQLFRSSNCAHLRSGICDMAWAGPERGSDNTVAHEQYTVCPVLCHNRPRGRVSLRPGPRHSYSNYGMCAILRLSVCTSFFSERTFAFFTAYALNGYLGKTPSVQGTDALCRLLREWGRAMAF